MKKMFRGKSALALLTAVSIVLSLAVPALSAAPAQELASREYVTSEFVQSIGRTNLVASEYMLSTFKDYEDVSEEYAEDMAKAVTNGIVRGYEDKTIRPQENIRRVEAMLMLLRSLDDIWLEETAPSIEFSDVPEWAAEEIDQLVRYGLVVGRGDGTLGAFDPITVEEVGILVSRSDELLNAVSIGESFYGHINDKIFRNYTGSSTSIDPIHGLVIVEENVWNHFIDRQEYISAAEEEILTKLLTGELEYEPGTPEQRVYDMYQLLTGDQTTTESDDLLFQSYLDLLTSAQTLDQLMEASARILRETGVCVLLNITAELDSDTNVIYPGIGLTAPNLASILTTDKNVDSTQQMADYRAALERYLKLMGFTFIDYDLDTMIQTQLDFCQSVDLISLIFIGYMLKSMIDEDFGSDENAFMDWIQSLMDQYPEQFGEDALSSETISREAADALLENVSFTQFLDSVGYKNYEKLIYTPYSSWENAAEDFSEETLTALKLNAAMTLQAQMDYYTPEQQDAYNDMRNAAYAGLLGVSTEEVAKAYSDLESLFSWDISFDEDEDADESDGENPAEEPAEDSTGEPGENGGDESQEDWDEESGEDWNDWDEDWEDMFFLDYSAVSTINSILPEDIPQLFCNYYFDDAALEQVSAMIDQIRAGYEKRFRENTWMSDSTKEEAIKKLNNMLPVLGYPTNSNYPTITSAENGGTYFSNMLSINRNSLEENIRLCEDPGYIREMFLMNADDVNAGYISILNTINIPAGILGDAFFDPEASAARNLGSLGSILGHEIGHAFDAEGSQYDENGILRDWWTEEDAATYEEIKQRFIDYYNEFEVGFGIYQDAETTITENMADFAGMTVIMDILDGDLEAQKEALEAYASMWAQIGNASILTSDDYLNDVHAANSVRVDAVVASLDCFYEIYDVPEDSDMYIAPADRLTLW